MQLIYCLLIPVLLGFFIAALILSKKPLWLILSLSYPLGIGILSFIMFILGILRIPLSLMNISAVCWIIITLFAALAIKTARMPGTARLSILPFRDWILLSLILIKLFYVFFEATLKPVFTWDAWSRYALVAKAIYYEKTFLNNYILHRIEDYPLLIPLNQAWILIGQGFWNDTIIKIISPMLLLSLLCVFFYGMRKNTNRSYALFFTFLLSTLPFIIFHSTTAYLDFPMTFYYSAGTISLYLFIKDNDKQYLIVSAILLGLGIWVKRSAIYLVGIDIFILFIYLIFEHKKEILLNLIKFIVILAAIYLPWMIYNKLISPIHYYSTGEIVKGIQQDVFSRTPLVFQVFIDKMFHSANWHLSWALFFLSLIFFPLKIAKSSLKYLFLIIFLNILVLLFIFNFTGSFQFLLDGTLFNRVMMYMMPLVLFFGGLVFFVEKNGEL